MQFHNRSLYCILNCLNNFRIVPGAVLPVQQCKAVLLFSVVPYEALNTLLLGSADIITVPRCTGRGVFILVDCTALVNDYRRALADKSIRQILEGVV